MALKLLHLEGPSLAELKARVLAEHGPRARIVAAEKVTVGGIRGFFARQHYEVTVEVPHRPAHGAHLVPDPVHRAGLVALLDDADQAELSLHREPPKADVSTDSDAFAALMDDLTFNISHELQVPSGLAAGVAVASVAPAVAPALLRGAGDLVVCVGLPADAVAAAGCLSAAGGFLPAGPVLPAAAVLLAMAGEAELDGGVLGDGGVAGGGRVPADGRQRGGRRADVRMDGEHTDGLRITGRRAAAEARARGVEADCCVVVAFGLPAPGTGALGDSGAGAAAGDGATRGTYAARLAAAVAELAALGPDQVWVAVDAGRKHEDTAAWVAAVAAAVPVDGVIVQGSAGTASPETVHDLGLPIGWVDGRRRGIE